MTAQWNEKVDSRRKGDFYQLYQPRWFGCERDIPWGGKGILGWAGVRRFNWKYRAGNKRGAIPLHYKHLHTLEPSATAHLHNGITKYLFESLYCVLSQKVWQRFFSFSNCLVVSIFPSAGHSVLTAAEWLIIEYCLVWSVVVVCCGDVVSTTTTHILVIWHQ